MSMRKTLLFVLAGSLAQFVDGTLGMAFGVTSTTLLVTLGTTALVASAAVHFAELGTTLVSGLSHWREGNIDRQILIRLAIPGAIGGFIGATVLSHISTEGSKTYVSALLLTLGAIIIIRFGAGVKIIPPVAKVNAKLLAPLGLVGGFVDASGGGGWGPISTPTLLALTKSEPRKVIGTVSASEFLVTAAASLGFILAPAASDTAAKIDFKVVLALMLGGIIMAPIAARLTGRLPHAPFGVLVGGLVLITNSRTIMKAFGVPGPNRFLVLCALGLISSYFALLAWKRESASHEAITPTEVSQENKLD